MTDDDEILDLVNADDVVVGTIRRGDVSPENRQGNNLRAASCFVMNSQGQLWVPRRQLTKRIKPGALDFSAGGHIGAGEDYLAGLLREITEEIGLEPAASDLLFIAKQTPSEIEPYYYFQAIYLLYAQSVPHYNREDFSGFEWLTIPELRARLQAGELAKGSLDYSLQQLSAYVAEHQGDH